ncbi:MAG: tRNA (adenosine(37)-N6)-threonylcarbamoyltransferase complex ATPase subunit type 1 TsaE [Candidatus Moranbacteria bacterium RIFCSPHIGHO2_01_FULL_55_24]|nr:MAG: tRNA (adenosine(37)-N6)-threonylcarbamoyltransferase complex ATPase subunit type 1 TsaE [Candidatus Moranbacteria bacterium RIFCSPHIGHO2_01_FULL_55_24]
MEKEFFAKTKEETRDFGRKLALELAPGTFLALSGDLGAGKTALAQGILEGLGASGPYVSPTFVIMKEYALPEPSPKGVKRVYHADAYRVEAKDFDTIGFAEWGSDPEGLVILEWPERVSALLPAERLTITLLHEPDAGEGRHISIS